MTDRTSLVRVLVAGLAGMGLTAVSWAQNQSPNAAPAPSVDSFVVGWQMDRLSGPDGGAGGSFDWVRTTALGRVYTAGAASFSLGDRRWTLGRIGTALRLTAKLMVSAQATLGGGTTPGDRFGYQSLRSELTYRVTPRLAARMGDEYVNIDTVHGHLVKLGTVVRVSDLAALDLSYATSAGGNLNTRLAIARLDLATRPVRLFGGGAAGSAAPEIFDLRGVAWAASQQLREGFIGIGIPVSWSEVRVVFDVLRVPAVTRHTLTFGLAFPVGP